MSGARGEGYLTRDGEPVAVLFTNRALAQAEQALGKSVLAIARHVQEQDFGMGDVAHLLRIGLEAARREAYPAGTKPVTLEQAYDLLDAVGFGPCAAVVLEAFAAVLSYEGKAGPAGAEVPPVQ